MTKAVYLRICATLFSVIFCSFSMDAQTKLKGTVIDNTTGETIIGAIVKVSEDPTKGAETDFDGAFEMTVKDLPVTLTVSYIGYEDVSYPVSIASQKIEIKMGEQPVTIDLGVEIKGQRISDKQKAAPLTIESLDAIAIKQTASTDFYNGLGSLKGVDLTTASLGFTVINMRGFNSTSPVRSLQTIDGVDNQSPGLNFSLGNFLGASELDVLKVDLVVGASSAFYGPNAFNGVIAMETKNPFFHQGLAASVKVGERNLLDVGFRYGEAFKNKSGKPVFAYKVNFSHLRANDWVADNYDAVSAELGNDIFTANQNPGGKNAVNIYGDEYSNFLNGRDFNRSTGLNSFHRRGYKEEDLVDYNTRNTKAGIALHFRTKPSLDFDSPEIVVSSNFGYGTTVYQGDNRFSLKGIQFYQHKLEFRKKDKYFLRAYATHEDAGQSYDPYFTAQKLIESSSTNSAWERAYRDYWEQNKIFAKMQELGMGTENIQQWQIANKDKLDQWHSEASNFASSQSNLFDINDFYEPGTSRFDSLFNDITSRKNNLTEKGTRFFDKSALYHMHGEYKIASTFFKDLTVGSNFRLFRPNTAGTIFNDEFNQISNSEFGVYTGASKEFGDFTLSGAIRLDKNKNFKALVSPAGSIVYKPSLNNYLRLSFSSAIRNPTLSDQYLDLDVGPAKLLGNLNGFDSLVTLQSFLDYRRDPTKRLIEKSIDPIQPEKVKTFEVGYRTTLFDKLFLDVSYYYNIYNDFIGYQIGLKIPVILVDDGLGGQVPIRQFTNISAVRVAANSDKVVNSQGFALGFNYYFQKHYAVNGNYSFNNLVTNIDDDIVPAFNTPTNKYNIGISGRDIPSGKNLIGFNINYKWIEGFTFEGSPQFTGLVPTYDLLDCQANYSIPKSSLVFKLGASNVLNNKQFQTYGGPRIGRMAYLSITYDFKKKI